ncbi:MAG: hypothetical protein AB1894_09730 [Chloroflexota bacterium]
MHSQKRARKQKVKVKLSAVPLQVYAPDDHTRTKPIWLARAKIENAVGEPWYLLTDWPVTDADSALLIFIFYRDGGPSKTLSSSSKLPLAIKESLKFLHEAGLSNVIIY